MKIILATNNEKKVSEIREIMSGSGIDVLSMKEAGISALPEEDGDTFEENALIKARAVMEASGSTSLADDSGLEVFSLGNRPGVLSARYGAPEALTDADRNALLLREMEGVPEGLRGARFVCSAACAFPDGSVITARGECAGEILRSPAGGGGFGYDPLFYVPEAGRTMAELSSDQKNLISHRGKAFREFIRKVKER